MDIKKIQVVSFAIRNKMLGYQLLKTPKGSSPYQIKMIKTRNLISPELDRYDQYFTKSRDFSEPKSKTEKQTLLVERYMFRKSKNDKKTVKEMFYTKEKANGEYIANDKQSDLTADDIINRDTSYIDKEHVKGYHKELIPFLFIPVEHTIPNIESIKDKEINKFFEQQRKKAQKRNIPSFWAILKQNIKG